MNARIKHLLALTAALCAPMAHADFYLVVPAANPQTTLTQKEAVDLFMGRNRAFRNGDPAQVYDLPRDTTVHADFYQRLTGIGPAQVNSYWARLLFSGQTMPPQQVADENTMVEALKRNPKAIGWLQKEPVDRQLRVLLVLKESN